MAEGKMLEVADTELALPKAAKDASICRECGKDRLRPQIDIDKIMLPPCWRCGQPVGCNRCVKIPWEELKCDRCGVWVLRSGFLRHGARVVPFDEYPAGWRIFWCIEHNGDPAYLRPAASAWFHQRTFAVPWEPIDSRANQHVQRMMDHPDPRAHDDHAFSFDRTPEVELPSVRFRDLIDVTER